MFLMIEWYFWFIVFFYEVKFVEESVLLYDCGLLMYVLKDVRSVLDFDVEVINWEEF